jgi:hypothetical protein
MPTARLFLYQSSLRGFSAITLLIAELIRLHLTEHPSGMPASYRLSPLTIEKFRSLFHLRKFKLN